jgi:hypothetical protein
VESSGNDFDATAVEAALAQVSMCTTSGASGSACHNKRCVQNVLQPVQLPPSLIAAVLHAAAGNALPAHAATTMHHAQLHICSTSQEAGCLLTVYLNAFAYAATILMADDFSSG